MQMSCDMTVEQSFLFPTRTRLTERTPTSDTSRELDFIRKYRHFSEKRDIKKEMSKVSAFFFSLEKSGFLKNDVIFRRIKEATRKRIVHCIHYLKDSRLKIS